MLTNAAIKQAYDLAQSGLCRSVSEIMRRLPKDDRVVLEAHLAEPSARRQLILVCSQAWISRE